MNNLNKKQKIIAGIIASIIAAGICYYVYAKDTELLTQEQNLEIEQLEQSGDENKNTTSKSYHDTLIMVHVSGAVNKEGIVELKQNSRIADAIEKAEGLKENACMEEINLAYVVEDGMKIHIPTQEEKQKNDIQKEYITKSSGIETKENTKINHEQSTKININTATQTELETLPGIGPSTALKIISYRKEKGKFKTIEEIKEVSGIGDSKFNSIKDLINV